MSITLTEVRAVRIICDEILKDELLQQLTHLGATGYTWWHSNGSSTHPTSGYLSELRRVYIEVWCNLEVGEKFLTHCNSSQFRNANMVVGVTSLSVSEEMAAKIIKK